MLDCALHYVKYPHIQMPFLSFLSAQHQTLCSFVYALCTFNSMGTILLHLPPVKPFSHHARCGPQTWGQTRTMKRPSLVTSQATCVPPWISRPVCKMVAVKSWLWYSGAKCTHASDLPAKSTPLFNGTSKRMVHWVVAEQILSFSSLKSICTSTTPECMQWWAAARC